jgi:hypothetical protein
MVPAHFSVYTLINACVRHAPSVIWSHDARSASADTGIATVVSFSKKKLISANAALAVLGFEADCDFEAHPGQSSAEIGPTPTSLYTGILSHR